MMKMASKYKIALREIIGPFLNNILHRGFYATAGKIVMYILELLAFVYFFIEYGVIMLPS